MTKVLHPHFLNVFVQFMKVPGPNVEHHQTQFAVGDPYIYECWIYYVQERKHFKYINTFGLKCRKWIWAYSKTMPTYTQVSQCIRTSFNQSMHRYKSTHRWKTYTKRTSIRKLSLKIRTDVCVKKERKKLLWNWDRTSLVEKKQLWYNWVRSVYPFLLRLPIIVPPLWRIPVVNIFLPQRGRGNLVCSGAMS